MNIPDIEPIVIEHLMQEGTVLYELVGKRIWSPIARTNWKNDAPAIVAHVETIAGHPAAPTSPSTVVLKCYGGSMNPDDAKSVAHATVPILHQLRGSQSAHGTILKSDLIVMFPGPPEQTTGWPVWVVKYGLTVQGRSL